MTNQPSSALVEGVVDDGQGERASDQTVASAQCGC